MEYELFTGLKPADRQAVLSVARRRRFKRGEVIFHEGDPGDTFHHVASGHVAIRVSTTGGDTATLAVLGPGDGFGEQALLSETARRSATAAALEGAETLSISNGDFRSLRETYATVDDLLIQHLARVVVRLSNQVAEALYVPAEKRVLRRVLELDALYLGAAVPVTQEDIASMAGTTRPTANRALQSAAEAGIVELGRSRVAVVDRPALEKKAR